MLAHENPALEAIRFRRSLALGIILFLLALVVQIGAGRYSSQNAIRALPASDLFLDNLPVVDLSGLIVKGGALMWLGAAGLGVLYRKYSPFGLKAVSLYIIIRAFFINLTHLGLYPLTVFQPPSGAGWSLYNLFTFQGNFFFSGHTGFPFLLALIFWNEKNIRRVCLFLSAVFGAAVLLAHVHYSIDVFAAPFMVYSIFVIARRIFSLDYHRTLSAVSREEHMRSIASS